MKKTTPAEYVLLIKQCQTLVQGRNVHARLVADGLDRETYLGNHLVQMYGVCRSLTDAQQAFDKLEARNVFSWNIIITACIHNDKTDQARRFFHKSPKRDAVTWNAMITAYAQYGDLRKAKCVFSKMTKHNVSSWNSMVTLLGKNYMFSEAKHFFDAAPERNLVTWHAMIVAYSQNGDLAAACCAFEKMSMQTVISFNTVISAHLQNGSLKGAADCFRRMPEQDSVSWNSLITAYAQSGNLQEASRIFRGMSGMQRSLTSCNAMIAAYVQNQNLCEARSLFDRMATKNSVSWNTMITAYARNGLLEEAKALYDQVTDPDIATSTSMFLAFACAGRVEEARELFESLQERDVICWSAMMTAYAQNGHVRETVKLFTLRDLEGVPQDRACFVVVIEACTSLSDSSLGRILHSCAADAGFGGELSVGNALVSMYGKCGCLAESRNVFDDMLERNVVSWNSLMTAYAQNGYAQKSLEVGRGLMLDGQRPDFITFINILSACGHEGLWKDGRSYFSSISRDHEVEVTIEHYHCMIDLLARSGGLEEAEVLIKSMPFKADDIPWRSLLSGAHSYGDVDAGARAAEQLVKMNRATTSEYVMMANIYKASPA